MPALNFTMFIAEVENGTKRQTIRATRKRPIKAGDLLYFYTGMRTKHTRLLRDTAYCKRVRDIKIGFFTVDIDGIVQTGIQENILAQLDGFDSFVKMFSWFKKTHGLPFHGQIINW